MEDLLILCELRCKKLKIFTKFVLQATKVVAPQ